MLLDNCVCGGTEFSVTSKDSIALALCRCGIARQISTLSAETYQSQYNGAYHTTDRHPGCVPYRERYANDLHVAELRWKRFLELAGFKVLDVGAANGAFVDYLCSIGIKATGIDPDPQSERVQKGTIADVDERFDMVTYHDVLEHIVDPVSELHQVFQCLRPGGILIVDVPYIFDGQGDHHIKREHLWFFNAPGLHRLLCKAGFEPRAMDHPIPGKLVMYAERRCG